MLESFLESILAFMDKGGFVMLPLSLMGMVLWYAIGCRMALLKRGNVRSVRVLVFRYAKGYKRPPSGIVDSAVIEGLMVKSAAPRYLRKVLDERFGLLIDIMKSYKGIISAIVICSPLCGLLGTVSGMIETFESLSEMALFTQTGGIAGGISEALFTTQMGLAVAIPGLLMGRMLDRKEENIAMELDKLKDFLCSEELEIKNEIFKKKA